MNPNSNRQAAAGFAGAILVIAGWSQAAVAQIPGLSAALDPTVTIGTVINIPGPPSTARDFETANSVAGVQSFMDSHKGPGSVYDTINDNFPTVQNPSASLAQIGSLVQAKYANLVTSRMNTPTITSIDVDHFTYNYPAGYDNNAQPVTVHTRRMTFHAPAGRTLVAYYANYDKIAEHNDSILLQVNGHFLPNPTRRGFGLEDNGGKTGGALGKIAMQGYPLIAYDDHNVGESSPGPDSPPEGLPYTLENLQMMDRTFMTHFDRIDTLGLSGGTERLFHYMNFFESNVQSVYYGGWAMPEWTRLTRPPFATDFDTHDPTYQQNFQLADLALVGIARGVDTAFAHNANDSGMSKYGYFVEMVPTMLGYTNQFETRGNDLNGDGVPESGPALAHEYDLPDVYDWIAQTRGNAPTQLAWNLTGQGSWHTQGNWTPVQIPNGAEVTAVFGSAITADSTVVADSDVTVHAMEFDNANRYVVAGTGTISLSPNAASVAPSIAVAQGDHEFQAAVRLLDDTLASVAAGSMLAFNNELDLNGYTLTKTGSGTLLINNHLLTGGGMVINAAGAIAGIGTISGDVINTHGVLSPGSSGGIAIAGHSSSPISVPEPACGVVTLLGVAGILLRRRT